MKDKLLRFINNTIGDFQEVSYKDALYQCMDLVYEWVFCLDIPKATIQHEFAYEVYTQATDFTRQYFEIIENKLETIPQCGDIVVFKGGKAGHIAIVIEATQTKMKVYDQNKPLGTNANISDESYTNCLGFLRPKNVIIDAIPQWFLTLLQENNLTLEKESDIRSLFDKAKRYNDEVATLRQQVISANETLADKALELSNAITKTDSLSSKVDELDKLYNDAKKERDEFSFDNQKLKILTEELQKGIDSRETQITQLKIDVDRLQGNIIDVTADWKILFSLAWKAWRNRNKKGGE